MYFNLGVLFHICCWVVALSVKPKLSALFPDVSTRVSNLGPPIEGGTSSTGGPTGLEFRSVLKEIFISNKLSSLDVFRCASSAQTAGAQGVSDLSRAGHSGAAPKNLARDLMRSMLKGCCVPELFWWQIPLWDVEEQKQTMSWHSFLLPHEMVHWMVAQRGLSFFRHQPR